MAIAAVFALSFNLLFGQTGLLSFGHAVYFGLGAYAAIMAMRAINQGLALPIVAVPIAGMVGGLVAGIAFGAVTTRKAGTIFALISLGVGELVYAATFMLPGLFGGEEGITASRTRARSTWTAASHAAFRLLRRRDLGGGRGARDVRVHANAGRTNVQRGARQSRACRVRRVQHATRALRGVRSRRAVRGLAGGLHAINYEIVAADAVSAQRSGHRADHGVHGRRLALHRSRARCHRHHVASEQPVRLHVGVAPVPRAVLHRDDPVRADGLSGLVVRHARSRARARLPACCARTRLRWCRSRIIAGGWCCWWR
jgi:hypothetical protein